MAFAFWGTSPNLNRAVNELNRRTGILNNLVNALSVFVDNVSSALDGALTGQGNIAAIGDMEDAVKWAIAIAEDNSHGYDQKNREGPDYDCSSLVYCALRAAGFPVTSIGTTYTMKADLPAMGFKFHEGVDNSSILRRGDILWRSSHTEIYIGSNKRVGAHCNELGTTTGGKTGDQTGEEISIKSGLGSWSGYFRYEPVSTVVHVPSLISQTGIVGDYTANYASVSWASGTKQRQVYNKWNMQSDSNKYKDGIATIGGRYLVALRPKFGQVGDKVNINLVNGEYISAIIADEKGEDAGNEWGHVMDGAISIVEFEAQTTLPTEKVPSRWKGQRVTNIRNFGSVL